MAIDIHKSFGGFTVKRTVSLLLCTAVLLVLLPARSIYVGAFASDYNGQCGDNVYWSLDTGTGTLEIYGTGDMKNYDSENPPWYGSRSSVTSIVIGESVSSVGNYAFRSCSEAKSVIIPESVTSIGSHAFSRCGSLSAVIIPENVTKISNSAFSYCTGLASITIPENVTEIDDTAFAGCGDLTIICFSGSEAHRYAVRNDIPYEIIITEAGIEAVDGSGAAVDHEQRTISGIGQNLSNLDAFIISCGGAVIEYSTDIIGTGTVVSAVKDGNVISSYTVILYGDIDENGRCDGSDAFAAYLISSGLLETESLTPEQLSAADANRDGVINEQDVVLLEDAGLLLVEIEQTPSRKMVEARHLSPVFKSSTTEDTKSTSRNDTFLLILEDLRNIFLRIIHLIHVEVIIK